MKKSTVRVSKASRATRAARFAILSASIFGVSAITVRAVSWYWDSTTNNWSSSTDWVAPGPVGPPVSAIDTILNFGGSGATSYTSTDDLTGAFTLNGLIFNSSASVTETVTVGSGNSLDLEANAGVNPTVTNSGAGSFTVGAPIALGAATTFGGTGTGTVTVSGVVSGSAVTVSGGHYALNNKSNSFNGLTVTGGILEIAAGAGPIDVSGAGTNSYFGAGSITINGGELRLTTTGNTANNVIFNTALGQTINFGTAGGILNLNGMDNTTGLNITLANAPAATAVVKFAGGAQGLDGSFGATATAWADDTNALRFTTIGGATASTPLEIDVTNGAELVLNGALGGTITEPLTISGVAGGNESAGGGDKTTGRVAVLTGPYTFSNGLFLSNTLQIQAGGGARIFNGNITLNPGANVGFQGRGTATAIGTPEASALELGTSATVNASTLTVSNGAIATMDVRFRTDLATAHGIQLFDKTNILAGGTLAFTQSYAMANGNNVGWVEVGGNIVGNGTTAADSVINLLVGAANTAGPFTNVNGVVFDSGSNLIVNGTGFGGLKVTASGAIIRTSVATGAAATYLYGPTGASDPVSASAKVSNLLTSTRLAALTGSGGYLTPAASGVAWNFPAGGEWGAGVPVGLHVSNSNAGGVSVSLGALSAFQHNVAIDAGATLDTGASNITFGPASVTAGLGLLTGAGTISGTGGITINNGATVLPGLGAIGTLTVGNITINGTLQIAMTNTPSTDLLAVNGNLTLGANSILSLPATNTYSTTTGNIYTLATFSGLTGTFGSIQGLPVGYQVAYGSNSITLQSVTIVSRVWNGNISGAWDVNGTANWQGATTFDNGDTVTFDGTAAGPNFTVTVTGGNVSPAAITVDTTAHAYTLVSSAAAQITGTAVLTKNGNGILTLSGPATYGGGTAITKGTLALGSNNAVPPTGPVNVASGAILDTQGFSNVLADLTVNGAVNGATGTLTVNSLTLGSAATFAPNLVLHGPLTANNPNAMVLAGNIDLGGAAQTFAVTAGTAPELTLNGVISNGGLTKAGNGTLVLGNAANSYTGGTIVNGGTLRAPLAGSLPSGTAVTINGGTLDTNANPLTVSSLAGTGGTLSLGGAALNLAQGGNSSFAGSITGSGTVVTKTLGGALVLSGSNTFSGGLNVNGGVLIAGSAGAVGSGTVTVNPGGDFQVGAALTAPIVLAGGTLSSQGTTQVTNSTLTASSNSVILLADATNLGTAGDMPLTGTLAGTGNLSVTAGTSGVSADAGPGFRLRGAAASTYSGTITAGQFVKVEMQTAVAGPFSPAGAGNFVLTGGSYTTGSTNGNYSEVLVRNNFAGDTVLGNNVALTGTVAGGTAWGFLNLVSVAPGPGVIDLLGSVNQFGTLTLRDGQGLGVYRNAGNVNAAQFTGVTLTGGTSSFAADPIGFTATGSANLILGPIVETARTNVVFAIGQSNATTPVAGTILLNSANSYTGSTTIATGSTGTLALGAPGALPAGTALTVNGGTLDVNFNGASNDQMVSSLAGSGGSVTNSDPINTRTLTVNQSSAGGATTFSGQIAGNLNLTKAGSGTLILANGGSYSGQTMVTGGVLSVNGALPSPMVTVASGALYGTGVLSGNVTVGTGSGPNASAIIDPADNASTGTLTTGPLFLANSDAAYVMELNSSTLTSDLLMATGNITLGIGLTQFIPRDLGSALLAPGQVFIIAQSTTAINGEFANFPEGQQFALNGNFYSISYMGAGATEITLTTVPEPGALSALATGAGLLTGLARFRRRKAANTP